MYYRSRRVLDPILGYLARTSLGFIDYYGVKQDNRANPIRYDCSGEPNEGSAVSSGCPIIELTN
jgi:hypothetical protein